MPLVGDIGSFAGPASGIGIPSLIGATAGSEPWLTVLFASITMLAISLLPWAWRNPGGLRWGRRRRVPTR